MTDHTIPAEKLREIIDMMDTRPTHPDGTSRHSEGYNEAVRLWDKHLRALLPEPPLPTLADMTSEERAECQWMQADTEELGRFVIVNPCESGIQAGLISRMGNVTYESSTRITPRPDLPRMEWPGEQKPSPAFPGGWRLADHPEHGRVIVTKPTPDYEGYIYYMYSTDARPEGYDWDCRDAAELTFCDEAPAPEQEMDAR